MLKLPPLPLLPPSAYKHDDHPSAELFASQITLDAALYSNSIQNNSLEALLLAQDSGNVRLILYDALSIGEVSLPTEWRLSTVKMHRVASHPFSSTYMFLVGLPSDNAKPRSALLPLSLRFLHSSGNQLHIIESKTAQLELLVQYVGECLLALCHHWKHAQELPGKFMAGINDDLAEKNEPNLVQSLFHLAATGDCPPTLKEWLVDILAERGHKRWDHSITHGYTKVLELTHENLLPALDRCVAILSHLRGLAIYYEHSPVFNVPYTAFDTILNIIRCIRLLAHHVLLYCSEETQQFHTFSKWLRHEIDLQASDSPPDPAEEVEQDINVDYSLLLAYIQGALVNSKLDPFVKWEPDLPPVTASLSMYDDIKKILNSFKKRGDVDEELINMRAYFDEWMRHNRRLVDQITSHQRASSLITTGIVIEEGEPLVSDIRMVYESTTEGMHGKNENTVATITAIVHKSTPNQINFTKITHDTDFEGFKSIRSSLSGAVSLPSGNLICDLKFEDDQSLMLLVTQDDHRHLVSIPYTESISASFIKGRDAELCQVPDGQALNTNRNGYSISDHEMKRYTKHTFEPDDRFHPLKIEVNGRRNRRFVVALGEDKRMMRIFDLDYSEDEIPHNRQPGVGLDRPGDEDSDEVMKD
ncbi:hypothetical protein, variant [Verruconis gallopava]|nr:hypothetical protein, variant [Verruconis gallopava]KIW04896.1 hypothetical protein, variant [Verruconis gallopava]